MGRGHDEAEVLEHAVSERVVDSLDRALGHPDRDPHGDPIPPKRGRHAETRDEPLDAVEAGTRVPVERVSDHDPEALRWLGRRHFVPGTELTVVERAPFGGPLWVRAGSRRHALGDELVGAIFVTVLNQ